MQFDFRILLLSIAKGGKTNCHFDYDWRVILWYAENIYMYLFFMTSITAVASYAYKNYLDAWTISRALFHVAHTFLAVLLHHFFVSLSDYGFVICLLLASLNSCVNPWIYVAFSGYFQSLLHVHCEFSKIWTHEKIARMLNEYLYYISVWQNWCVVLFLVVIVLDW